MLATAVPSSGFGSKGNPPIASTLASRKSTSPFILSSSADLPTPKSLNALRANFFSIFQSWPKIIPVIEKLAVFAAVVR